MSKRSEESAFTLIEILLVLGIISTLVAIATPQYYDYKSRSNDAQAQADAKNSIQIMTANLSR
ncbi:type IV pilin protein [Stutzerimonas sp. R40042]|uniref:type IV pilin protein n=1 Tax=Stutzerimonas sp. R40042 TaxID=2998559 RepID=UPI003FA3C2C5